MSITIADIRAQIRQLVDPLIMKLRQELYGTDIYFGQYIQDSKIAPNIPRTGTGGTAVTGSGTAAYITKWTGTQSVGNSLVKETASGITLTSGILVASGIQLVNLTTLLTGTSLGVDTNNNIVKLTNVTSSGGVGISSVPQRFGWYIDQEAALGVNGPVHYLNTSFDVLEYNIFFKSVPQNNFVFRIEMTDMYNPTFNGAGVTWWNLLAANGGSASDTNLAASTVVSRIPLSPQITPKSRNNNAQPIGSGIIPSGSYGVWLRLYVVSGALENGTTITMLMRSNGSI